MKYFFNEAHPDDTIPTSVLRNEYASRIWIDTCILLQIAAAGFHALTISKKEWPLSTNENCALCVLGPPASILIKKTSVRTVQLIGGGLAILGHLLCLLATKPWHVFVFFSFIAGKKMRIRNLVLLLSEELCKWTFVVFLFSFDWLRKF